LQRFGDVVVLEAALDLLDVGKEQVHKVHWRFEHVSLWNLWFLLWGSVEFNCGFVFQLEGDIHMVVVLVHVIFLLGLLKPLQQLIDRNLLGYDLFIPVEFQF